MRSSDAPEAFDFEQLDAKALVHTRLGGVRLVGDAATEEERGRRDALRSARERARDEAFAQARAEIALALSALRSARDELDAAREEMIERVERGAVELALSLTEQIVAGAVEVQPERVLDVVRGALRRLVDRHRITIVVNPDDLALLTDALGELRTELGGIEEATVQGDRRIARGGAVVQTTEGALDVELQSQLERARAIAVQELAR
jgi:flagellar assembly protein FliH